MRELVLPFLFYFSYTDIKTKEIRDEIVYLAFWLGIALNVFHAPSLTITLVKTLIVGLALHLMGVFALGDVWVALIISAWYPVELWGVPIALWALLGGSVLGALYGLAVLMARYRREVFPLLVRSFLIALPFSVHPLAGLAFLIFLRLGTPPLLALLFLPLVKNPALVFSFPLMALLLWSLKRSGEAFTREKEPEEGDVLTEVIDEKGKKYPLSLTTMIKIKGGEIRPAHSISADGLTKEDVERLKELGIRKVRVKETLPLVPFITLAFLLILCACYTWGFSCSPS